ncbi:MAG: hypothetical protein U0Q15_02020 [Kineosporiaceae bacterium]
MALTETAANAPVLAHLREQAVASTGRAMDQDGWQLHAHPDLAERLADACPPGARTVPAYGLSVLVVGGVAAGFVQGSGCLFLRLPGEPPPATRGSDSCAAAFAAPGWYAVDPWGSDLPSDAGLRRLRYLVAAACEHALSLG